VIFITEMITGGTLRAYIKKNKINKLRVIKQYCIEILNGLCYLHEHEPKPIIHRDLKCDNIFINSNNLDIRIGDLGLSTPLERTYTASVLGTPNYMAPELYKEHYDTAVDIYAFGMCVLEMITQEKPYSECTSHAQIVYKVLQNEPPEALERIKDPEVLEFIMLCLSPQKEKRPTARQLLNSPFLQNLENKKNNESVNVKPPKKRPPEKKANSLSKQFQQATIPEEEEHEATSGSNSQLQKIIADAVSKDMTLPS
jgi:WNK lysine deficient protein kinase